MSVKLRIRYQLRSAFQYIFSFKLPEFLTGNLAKAAVTMTIFFLMVGYFSMISNLTTSGYEIAKLEKQIGKLQDETKQLNTKLASEQSISKIQKRLEAVKMVQAGEIKYIKITKDSAVAQR